MHLVINDQAPVAPVKQRQVHELGVLPLAPRHDLVGRNRDRPNVFGQPAVFRDLVLAQRRFVEQLANPLPHRGHAGSEDQRRGLESRHAGHADDRFSRAARKRDDSRAAARASGGVKSSGGALLIEAKPKRLPIQRPAAQSEAQGLAVRVTRQVFGGKADLHQRLLDFPAVHRLDAEFQRR